MKKNKFSTYFIFAGVFSFFSLFVYIVQTSYNKLIEPLNQVRTNNLTKPVNPNLDIEILDLIESKKEYPVIENYVSTSSSSSATPSLESSGSANEAR